MCVTCFKLEKKTLKKNRSLGQVAETLRTAKLFAHVKRNSMKRKLKDIYTRSISLALSEALLSPVPLLSDFTGYQLIFTLINRPQDLQTFS